MPVTAALVPDRTTIRLSGSLTLRATLEGPAPLRVEAPAEILAEESEALWQIAPVGAARLVELPDGRQRWSQEFKASPFAAGPSVPLALREFSAAGGDDVTAKGVAFPTLIIHVETTIRTVKAEEARPATGIEELPPLPPSEGVPPGVVAFVLAVALLLVGGLFHASRRRRPARELPPQERALRDLDAPVTEAELPNRIAATLRTFAAIRFGVPADTMTTAELAKVHPDAELTAILEACDRARFAGVPWSEEEARTERERARSWVRKRPSQNQ